MHHNTIMTTQSALPVETGSSSLLLLASFYSLFITDNQSSWPTHMTTVFLLPSHGDCVYTICIVTMATTSEQVSSDRDLYAPSLQ